MKPDFTKLNGIIPAIIQDKRTRQILMLGFMNEVSFIKTKKTKKVTFFSRSKNRLWTKGETSKNYLRVNEILFDCDKDTLLILVTPDGPTCHTGRYSCFGVPNEEKNFLKTLEEIIQDRKTKKAKNSYVASLFRKGQDKIIQKFGEEAIETVIASKNKNKKEFIYEANDLLFHFLVLLNKKNIKLEDLILELKKRHKK